MNIYLSDEKIGDYTDSALRVEHKGDAKKLANAASDHTLREVIYNLRHKAKNYRHILDIETADIYDGLANEYEALLEKGQTDVKVKED